MDENTTPTTTATEVTADVIVATDATPTEVVAETAISAEVIDIAPSTEVAHIEPAVIAEEAVAEVAPEVTPVA